MVNSIRRFGMDSISAGINARVNASNIVGLIVLETGERYLKGDNPFYDMQIVNYICCPEDEYNYCGFVRSKYEPIYKQ
jgi:hypothetical protein